MNIALERCKEVSDGRVTRNWGDAFVRGNNGLPYLSSYTLSLLTLLIVTYICADNA
jgi:U6 snRNA-associated Sm-like protein LSm6